MAFFDTATQPEDIQAMIEMTDEDFELALLNDTHPTIDQMNYFQPLGPND
eukprot:gene17463-23076_t